MRYLHFNNLYLDTHNQLLIKDDEKITLAPKVYDLLVYFCTNQQRVISKDELMDKVWAGTIVTENAISRTLVKVRKALGDDPKNPEHIITVPKKGYRMVTAFTPCEDIKSIDNSEVIDKNDAAVTPLSKTIATSGMSSNSTHHASTANKSRLTIVAFTALSILSMAYVGYRYNKEVSVIETKQIKPLTREVAEELNPAVSPDLSKLAYTKKKKGQRHYINIEDLKTKTKLTLSHPRGKVLKPVWAPTQNKLAFLYQHNTVCVIYWADLDSIKDSDSWQAISECSADSSPQFVFSPNGQYFYFNDRQSNTNGYQIFRVDLATLQKDIVNQPITSGRGNYSFDISPDGEQLVLLNSEFAPQTRIYTLNIEDSLLTQTVELPYLMRSVRWSHDNQTILHPSPHPALEIWQSDLAGNKLSVFASNSSRIKHLSRVNNGKDISFVSYLLNRDIFIQDVNTLQQSGSPNEISLNNSSVMDYLPALSNDETLYAFVSKRSTTAEVYLSNVGKGNEKNEQAKRLTFFNNPVKIYRLAFSPSDNQLLIQADNQLYVINISDGALTRLPIDNISINGASWKDEQTIMFSTIKNNDWYVVQYDFSTQKITSLPTGYQGGIYSTAHKSYFYLADESGQVVKVDNDTNSSQLLNLYCVPSFKSRQLNLKLTGNGLACLSPDVTPGIAHHVFETNQIEVLKSLPKSMDLDVKSDHVIYTKVTQSVADIMQTSSL